MEIRKRLSDIGRQSRIKARKQEKTFNPFTCDEQQIIGDEVDFVATSLKKTGCYLKLNNLKTGQEPEIFANAVIHVNISKQSRLNTHFERDTSNEIDTCANNCQQNKRTKNNRTYERDDSGYKSDLSEITSNSDVSDVDEDLAAKQRKTTIETTPFKHGKDGRYCHATVPNILKESECDSVNEEVVVDESDEIVTSECVDIITKKIPKLVDKRWARNSLESGIGKYLYKNGRFKRSSSLPEIFRKEKYIKPDHKASIYIKHDSDDTEFVDEFGADLWTYETHQADGTVYKQHFFVNVKLDAPASKMKIKSYDEVVLLNSRFVPDLEHSEVLDLFKSVKVDGHTRFKLVLRRLVEGKCKKEWEWLESSAVLSPDTPKDFGKYPEVLKEKYQRRRSNEFVTSNVYYYKTSTKEQHYLDVKGDTLVANVLNGTDADKSKRIWRVFHLKILSGDPYHVSRKASLYSEINSKYIVIDNGNKIKFDEKPMQFDIEECGDNISFWYNNRYLAYNNDNYKVEASPNKYEFNEFIQDKVDQVDHFMQTALSNDVFSYTSTSPSSTPGTDVRLPSDPDTGSNNKTTKRKQESMEVEITGLGTTKKRLTLNTTENGSTQKACLDTSKTPTTPFQCLCLQVDNDNPPKKLSKE